MRKTTLPFTLAAVLLAGGSGIALAADGNTTPEATGTPETGTLINIDPTDAVVVFANGDRVLLPNTEATRTLLSSFKPGQVAVVDVTGMVPVLATDDTLWINSDGSYTLVSLTAPAGAAETADSITLQEPLTGTSIE